MRIAQVITNLVKNTGKFSAESKPTIIEVNTAKDCIIFSVEDKDEDISAEAH